MITYAGRDQFSMKIVITKKHIYISILCILKKVSGGITAGTFKNAPH